MIRALLALLVLAGCAAPEPPQRVALKGPLRSLIEAVPVSLATCTTSQVHYDRPFWRAPYRHCSDSASTGSASFEIDADSVVVSTGHTWIVPPHQQLAWWRREAGRLTREFGAPVRDQNQPPEDSSLSESPVLRVYCAAWRGPDSVEVTLYLDPATDVGPPREDHPWQLRRYARHGPLPGAVSCGERY